MQKKVDLSSNELVFVVETCQNCKEHHWNTRHDEAKYDDFFNRISSAIIQRLPSAVVLRNQIPKSYLPFDLYCNLIPNDDESTPIYDQVPRTGSFEVSYKGMLIFSKLQTSYWPNTQLVSEKCYLLLQDEKDNKDLTKYLAGNSPPKGGSVQKQRGVVRNPSRSPIRGYNEPGSNTAGSSFKSPQKQDSTKFSQQPQMAQAKSTPVQSINQQKQQQEEDERKQRQLAEERQRQMEEIQERQRQEQEAERIKQQKQLEAQMKLEEEKKAKAKLQEQEQKKIELQKQEQQKLLEEQKVKKVDKSERGEKAEKSVEKIEKVQQVEQVQTPHQDPKFIDQSSSRKDTVPVNQSQIQRKATDKDSDNYENEFEEPVEVQPEEDVEVGSQLKTQEDLSGYPLFPPGTKSLLKKYLSREVWDELKNSHDSHGFTFKSAIFSGCKNTDSGIGVYAGSHDSYKAFGGLFDKIIEDYHGHKKDSVHQSDMDFTKLNTPPFEPKEAKFIMSTRIRVGRNLADYPLGPGVNKAQRKEVEQKVVQALNSFQGELQGKYYSLSSLSEKERKQLIDDHFLFKEGDRFLEACGLNREWPDGRGIFHNNEKSFLVWVNEEDQLRIISMQQGADIGAVFTRLSKACTHIETVAKFAHDKHLGYITSCPTNLGTALRASVHIYLPNLGQKKEEFEAIADKFHVQIRGAHGEHTETDDHIYDISNKRRLGLSEVTLVQDMYNGVKAMIKREIELTPKEEVKDQQVGRHLKAVSELTGFPIFPEGTKSLLKKYLTREIFEQYMHEHDKHGFTFKQAIFSGCYNTDSSIGVYAGSHDSYHAFEAFFNKIIEDYHGHKKDAKHLSDMDYKKLNTPPLPEDEAAMIKSTRIRVGRNLADYPLGPGISKEQRKEIEQKVAKALGSFEGELAGKYYALSSLTEAERKQLIDDHFLFKEGDRFLEAVGLNREWPDGRGIFHNNEKSFLVWVNEEDQLRIISMQQGADIGAVFTRLSKACAHIEKVAKFAHDDHLGYITSCPTNLGTALRASVHIYLPNLGLKKEEFEAIANKYNVQIRGAHGEHTETNDHIYDISNKRRLGLSEVELVQDMYNGVKAMIKREKELTPEVDVKVGSHLHSPSDLKGFPIFPDGTKSLLHKYLSKAVWDELKNAKDKHGFSFKQAIFSGCKNTDSGIGLYAGSHDSYHAFEGLFDKVIEDYHGHKKNAKHISDMDYKKLVTPPLPEDEAAMIKSTRIRVGRNLAEFPLGPGLNKEQRKQIEQKVVQALGSFEGELAGKFYALASLTEAERKQLIDDHFLFKEGDRFLEACGLNREWPEGRGIFHNNNKSFLVWVNEEDQLRIISMQNGADIGAVFTRLSKACTHIETVAKFAHDDHLGYITSCPTNLGTALRASVHIHLPYLGQHKKEFEAIADQFFVQIRGAHGEHTETDDHIYDISNKRRLGRSEVDLVQDMYNGVKAMIQKEKELRPKEVKKEEVKHEDSKHAEVKHEEVKKDDTKHDDAKHPEVKHEEVKKEDAKHDDAKHPEVKHEEVKKEEAQHGETKHADAKHDEVAKKDDAKHEDTTHKEVKHEEPKKEEAHHVVVKKEEVKHEEEKDVEVGSHLKDPSDIKGFPVFPKGTHSLLSKYLTKEIWNQLKDTKCKYGYSFKTAIFSGCKNTDSGIGVYAGSHESYQVFAPLFDKIIEDYHGHKQGAKHVSDMDYQKLDCPPFRKGEAKLIKSTRIRVGRNLADYPLGPGLTKENRHDIEEKVVKALKSFEGELAGTYYALTSLTEEQRKQLIDDHFLFKEGDRFLEACGLNREWPDSRGIFHNNEKSFLVWVNEEDQLRIISMQQGADIGAVFTRLSKACTHIETVAKFAHDEHLGYITSCPTNLGTALRASVHISLPYLGQKKEEFQAIADKYHVQIRGIHGEHTETTDHVYDISNKRRLGLSEVSLVQDMYNGVKALITREKELTPPKPQKAQQINVEESKQEEMKITQCSSKLEDPTKLKGKSLMFPPGTDSLLHKYLTKEIWMSLKKQKDSFGFSFKQAIFSGCKNIDSGIGVYAGSSDSYRAFAPLFDKIIQDYHGHSPDEKHVSDLEVSKLVCPAFDEESSQMIQSTRIRVGRNLAEFPLGPGLSKEQRNEIEEKVASALSTLEGELKGTYYSLSSLSDEDRQQLINDHFLFKEGDRFLEAAGLNRDWPEGRGIFHNTDKTFLVWINEEDQLRIISMEKGSDIKGVFERLAVACKTLEKSIKFAHDDHLGYITSCPTNLGTALRASVHIKLPKLGQQKEVFEEIAKKYHIQIRGIHGEHSESSDHVYDISNKRRLGLSEVTLVQDMYNGVKAMIEKEKNL